MAEANKPVPKATISVYGKVRMKTAPSNPADPIAVGDNDPRLSPSGAPTSYENISGAGTTQGTATVSTAKKVFITGGAANSGIKCVDAILSYEQHFINKTSVSIYIYPFLGSRFLSGITLMAINAPILVASRNSLVVFCNVTGQMSTI